MVLKTELVNSARRRAPNIVAIGGGSGLSTMLRGLKDVSENITAIVAVSDDGGSSGVLRYEQSMLPPGDIRNCILALSNTEPIMEELLQYRFTEGALNGHSFGNLFLAALNAISPSFETAVMRMNEVLAVTGRVLPVTTTDVYLEAEFENGSKVFGESRIFQAKKQQGCRIKKVRLVPEKPPALPGAVAAIRNADMILLGPGSLYTSVIPNMLVDGMVDAIKESDALKVYVCNVMTQEGETEHYTVYDHLTELYAHSAPNLVDVCLVNSSEVPPEILQRYEVERAWPTVIDTEKLEKLPVEVISRPLLGKQRNIARHNPRRLAYELMELYIAKRSRPPEYAHYDEALLKWLYSRLD